MYAVYVCNTHTSIHAYIMYTQVCICTCNIFAYMYRIAGFLCEDFNHANGPIREIKIRVVFSTLHFVSRLQ